MKTGSECLHKHSKGSPPHGHVALYIFHGVTLHADYILRQKKVRILPGGLRPPGPPHLGLLGQAAWGLSPVGVLLVPFG